mmetsp:Transcript_41822/g.81984  ORF Transcript_41822/g.81984 Transcript_41822/m.81984 type:complete len:306 (+) Transcript_41822:570-1487(+)
MNAKNSSNVPPTAPGLLSKAGADPCIPFRQMGQLDPVVHVVSADRLFAGGNEIFFFGAVRIVGLPRHLVQLLVKIIQLRNVRHDILVHEERRLEHLVFLFAEERDAVVDEGLVQQDATVFEKVSAVPRDVLSPQRLVPVDPPQKIVVRQRLRRGRLEALLLQFPLGLRKYHVLRVRAESHHEIVRVLVLADGNLRVDHVADAVQQFVASGCRRGKFFVLNYFDLHLYGFVLRDGCRAVYFRFGFHGGEDDLLLNLVTLFAERILLVGEVSPGFVSGDNFVDPFGRLKSRSHMFAPFLGVAPPVGP